MQDEYQLTIIIPHYNSPDLLENLLSTIPSRKEIQTIVIDDHSPIEAKRQLKKIQSERGDKGILFLENNTTDQNAGAARNIGLNYAKGSWLLFADADDYFLEGFYEIIEKYFETDNDIIFFAPTSVDLDTGEQNVRQSEYVEYVNFYLEHNNKKNEMNLRYHWLAPWSKLIKRAMVDKNNIKFDLVRFSNDVMFSVKTGFLAKKIDASKDSIYCVTRNKGSLTTKLDLKTFEIRVDVIINYFKFLKTHLVKDDFKIFDAYRIPWAYLRIIIQRKYGVKVFFRYFIIFWKNKMFVFDIRIFTRIKPRRWIKNRNDEKVIKERYGE